MEEQKIRYHIPKPVQVVDKKTGKKGYKINDFTWYENGKRRKSDTHWHLTKDECIKEAESRIKDNADIIYIQSKMTVEGLINEYKDYIKIADIDIVAPSTKKNRYDNCIALLSYTPEKVLREKITKLDNETMKIWLNALKQAKSKRYKKTISSEYYDGLKNLISLILKWADDKNYFAYSLERITSLKEFIRQDVSPKKPSKRNEELRCLDFEEFRRFAYCCLYDLDISEYTEEEKNKIDVEAEVKVFNPHAIVNFEKENFKERNVIYFMFFCCMYFLGTRAEECRILDFKTDIKLDNGIKKLGRVTVSKAYTSYYFKSDEEAYMHKLRTKTEGSVRIIPIHPILNALLVKYKDYMKKHKFQRTALFPGEDNGFLSYAQINHKVERTLIKAGMKGKKFTKHDFRKSCAMYLCYTLKLPKERAISFFGWTSTDMLDSVYARYNELQTVEELEQNLDDVGFFDKKTPMFYIDNAVFYNKRKADKELNKIEPDEYEKYYYDDKTKIIKHDKYYYDSKNKKMKKS